MKPPKKQLSDFNAAWTDDDYRRYHNVSREQYILNLEATPMSRTKALDLAKEQDEILRQRRVSEMP